MSGIDSETQRLLKARDPEFLASLFADANPYLFRFLAAQRVVGPAAEELVQQTWLTFFEKLDEFEGRSQLKTFLAGILLNKLRETRRFDARVTIEDDPEKVYASAFTKDGWWASDPANPYELAARKELGAQIRACLEGLTPEQRAAFQLREIEDEATENICKILGVSVSHLGVLVFRAKDGLRRCLGGKR
jgi:RNA polymerase sigma factor (sigma-70 family)